MFYRYSYGWVTLVLFLMSLMAQWFTHNGTTAEFVNAVMENWQSEFLQLLWQVGGLSFLLFWGSPQSKEGNERLERKIDELLARGRGP